jgi:hypothetical protein
MIINMINFNSFILLDFQETNQKKFILWSNPYNKSRINQNLQFFWQISKYTLMFAYS